MAHQSTNGRANVTSYSPEPEPLPVVITKDEKKEEEWEPQSLEEALLGE